jgi:hypothetical protein
MRTIGVGSLMMSSIGWLTPRCIVPAIDGRSGTRDGNGRRKRRGSHGRNGHGFSKVRRRGRTRVGSRTAVGVYERGGHGRFLGNARARGRRRRRVAAGWTSRAVVVANAEVLHERGVLRRPGHGGDSTAVGTCDGKPWRRTRGRSTTESPGTRRWRSNQGFPLAPAAAFAPPFFDLRVYCGGAGVTVGKHTGC